MIGTATLRRHRRDALGWAIAAVMGLWSLYLGFPVNRLQTMRCILFGHPVPVYFFLVVLLSALAGAVAIAAKKNWSRWEVAWCALALICVPGIAASKDPLWSLRECASWMVRGVIPGGIIFLCARRRETSSMLLRWVYPIVVAAALLGLAEIFFKWNPYWEDVVYIPATSQPANPFYRPGWAMVVSEPPHGTQGNRIPYAATLVGFLPMALWSLRHKELRGRPLRLAAMVALVSIVILSQVRAVWAGASAGVLLMPLTGLMKRSRGFLQGALVTALIAVGFIAWPMTRVMLGDRFRSFHRHEISIRLRLDTFRTALVLKEKGLTGVGFGQFPTECRPYYQGALAWGGTADNQYLRWVTENGVPSLLALLAFFAWLIRDGLRRIRLMEDRAEAEFYLSLLVGWASVAVSFFFFDGFYWGACNMTFWCLLGSFATCLTPTAGRRG